MIIENGSPFLCWELLSHLVYWRDLHENRLDADTPSGSIGEASLAEILVGEGWDRFAGQRDIGDL